jgi:hypothetical protein
LTKRHVHVLTRYRHGRAVHVGQWCRRRCVR